MTHFRCLRPYLAVLLLWLGTSLALAAAGPRSDFFGTGTSDLLWRNSATGQVFLMPMKAGAVQQGTVIYTEPSPAWQIVAVADFDGDGKADILWYNSSTGQVYQMLMNGTAIKSAAMIYTEPNTAWQIAGTGDFDGDGKADILWRNTSTGAVYLMPLNGATVLPGSVIYTEPSPAWQIVAVADFDGDGKADILWWNSSTGQVYQMLMNGGAIKSAAMIYTEPNTDWKIVGTGDFNGDGKADLLWRNGTTGAVYLMPMAGATVLPGSVIWTEPNPAWQILAIGDFDGDGKDDIIWQNSGTGQIFQMLMNGAAVKASGMVYTEPNPAWGLQGGGARVSPNPAPGSKLTLSPSMVVAGNPSVISVTGSGFIPYSVVQVNGGSRTTAYVSPTLLTVQLTAADLLPQQWLSVTVVNPQPGGGTSAVAKLVTLAPAATPVLTQVSPSQILAGAADTSIYITGSNLCAVVGGQIAVTSSLLWNGVPLTTTGIQLGGNGPIGLYATVPASLLASAGTATVTASSATSTPALSNGLAVTISNPPPPILNAISPASGPIGTALAVTLSGTGFTANCTVQLNGVTIPATFGSAYQMTVNLPPSALTLPGFATFTVTAPPPGGGTSAAVPFTATLGLANNDMVYNPADGLLYASVPASAGADLGNQIVAIDPVNGNLLRRLFAGSGPNKLAISSDGTQLFVGLDGAASVAQVRLATGAVVNQFSLGGGAGTYNPLCTATALAAVPGQPNAVAVVTSGTYSGSVVTIYDAGVARAKTSQAQGYGTGVIAFGATASTLYLACNSNLYQLSVDGTGISGTTTLYHTSSSNLGGMQYDNGRLYFPDGTVFDVSSGALAGTFFASASSPATGPMVSDSALGLAFVASPNTSGSRYKVQAFTEANFLPAGSITYDNSSGTAVRKILRWGLDGLALNTPNQIYLLQSSAVKDLSGAPADLSVALQAPATAGTGGAVSYVATVKNLGPGQAVAGNVALLLDPSLIVTSVTASQGTWAGGGVLLCDLGNLASGASATLTVQATATQAGTLAASATVTSVSADPDSSNNQAAASTTVSGSLYSAVPAVTAISPALVKAGSGALTLTVKGSGFNANSAVLVNGRAIGTTFVSATQLTASVDAATVASYGWAPVAVSNPAPGGGTSQTVPLTIYASLNVLANRILYEPFGQKLLATIPSSSTSLSGNSIVAIDPFKATTGTPIFVGSEPDVMAETTSGNLLWIGLKGSSSLARFDLTRQAVTATFPLTAVQWGTSSPIQASWLAAMPGSDSTLAINAAGSSGTFGIFDVLGGTGSFRTNYSGIYDGIDPVFADAGKVYAFDSQTTGAEFYRYKVDATGLTQIDAWTLLGLGTFTGPITLSGGLVFGLGGGIIDPSTPIPTQIGVLTPLDFAVSGGVRPMAMTPDPSTRKEFMLLDNSAGYAAVALARYDIDRFVAETWLPMPSAGGTDDLSWQMLRFGQDGLALLGIPPSYSYPGDLPQLLLLRGPFVTPQLLQTNPAAGLASVAPASLASGAGNTLLTLTGTNFLPGVAVTWNGSYRTTTRVDASHVTVAIPASDLTAAATGVLVATNPGAPASAGLNLTIN